MKHYGTHVGKTLKQITTLGTCKRKHQNHIRPITACKILVFLNGRVSEFWNFDFLKSRIPKALPSGAVVCTVMEKPDESLLREETIEGRKAFRMSHVATVLRMAYFHIGDSALRNGNCPKQRIIVDYLDDGPGAIEIKYDAVSKPWKSAGIVEMTGSGQWRQVAVDLDDARFSGRCNGADFRLEAFRDVYFSKVYSVPGTDSGAGGQ